VATLGTGTVFDGSPPAQQQFTDAKGRFVFTGLRAFRDYTIAVTKSGHFTEWYVNEQDGHDIALEDGEWMANANVSLKRPGSLSGTVTDERGEPVIGVFVRALSFVRVAGRDQIAIGPPVVTDDRGMYRISSLWAGRYMVMVPSVQASAPSSASAGRLAGMSDESEAAAKSAGRALPALPPLIDVDADMRVGLSGYPVPPPPLNGRAFAYPAAFSGGAQKPVPSAAVAIDFGTDLTGLDVRLEPVPAYRVSGVVQGPPDARANLFLRLLAEGMEDLGVGSEAGTTLVGPDGSFVFANVPAGRYLLDAPVAINEYVIDGPPLTMFYGARIPRPLGLMTRSGSDTARVAEPGIGFSVTGQVSSGRYWGRTQVTVSARDESNVAVTLRPAAAMSGQMVVDRADPNGPPLPRRFFFHLETATGNPWQGSSYNVTDPSLAAEQFVIRGILPGLYVFRPTAPGWFVKSAIIDGRDYAHIPVDVSAGDDISGAVVTFTNAPGQITGTVRNTSGSTVNRGFVVVFPVEPDRWVNYGMSPARIRSVRVSSESSFLARPLPAGDYYAIAVPESLKDAWKEPDFFQRAQHLATRVSIGWGETRTVDLRLSQIR
jgi:hypothetical protein